MTERNEAGRKGEVDTAAVLDEISQRSGMAARSRSRRGPFRVLLFLLVGLVFAAALGGLAYWQWLLQQEMAALEQENRVLAQRVQETGESVADMDEQQAQELRDGLTEEISQRMERELDARITVDDQVIDQLQQSLSTRMTEIEGTVSAMRGEIDALDTREQRWLSIDAAYLVRLAQRRLQLETDVSAAHQLLGQARELLEPVDTAAAASLRQSLASDLRALERLQVPDFGQLHARLDTLATDVQNLSITAGLQNAYRERMQAAWRQQDGGDNAGSQGFTQAAMELLRTLFVWREREQAPDDILPPQQEDVVRQNMQLMLEQAQLSLLRRDQSVWRESLRQAREWHSRYFAADSALANRVGNTLDSLSRQTLVPALPDMSRSVELAGQLAPAEEN